MFDTTKETIRSRIKDLRLTLKVSQGTLAEYLGLKRSTFQNKELSGAFTWNEIQQIAEFFGESPFFIKYGVYDEELSEIVRQYISIKNRPSTLQDFRYTIFDDIEAGYREVENMADFVALSSEERNLIIEYITSKENL